MEQQSERRRIGTCCVCGKAVYRDENPILADVDCLMRHETCKRPKPAHA